MPARLIAMVLGAGFLLAVSGCNTVSVQQAHEALVQHLAVCVKQNHYDPNLTEGYAAHELAEGEREYLDCAYSGVENMVIPHTSLAADYAALIQEHRRMTLAVIDGQMTRQQRRARTFVMLDSLKAKEAVEEEKRQKEMDQMYRQIKEEQRWHDLQRPLERINTHSLQRALMGR